MPLGGSVTVVLTVGLNDPSMPVLPLLKAARTPNGAKHAPAANAVAMALALVLMVLLLVSVEKTSVEKNRVCMVEDSFIPAR
jgi:hypothetical protein